MAALDKLRDKWEAITPRERRMVVLLGVSTVIILILYVAIQIKHGLDELEAKNAKARRALVLLAGHKAQARTSQPDDPAAKIGAEPIKLETYIYNAGAKAQVTVPGVNTRTPTSKGKFVAHSATVELRDITLTQAKDFLQAIEGDSKIVVVSSMHLRRNFRDKEKLDLNVEIVTWARAATAAAGGGSGSGKGS
ncbi:MAG TPA: hypothetical protein VM734_00850 [Kofleriaceae bacterium]|jgi:hypothetical protein|nr:hypothetical protein [Kofleriaceae bacterium]